MVLPTRLLALCISAVAVAALVFIANDPDQAPDDRPTPANDAVEGRHRARPPPRPDREGHAQGQADQARQDLVEIFNNTRTKGLAGGVAAKAQAAGWNVVGTDNWYGTVDGTAVYYPPRFKAAARGARLRPGHPAVKPAEDPMQFDRHHGHPHRRLPRLSPRARPTGPPIRPASTPISPGWNSGAHGVRLDRG